METPQSIEAVGSDAEDAIARALEALNVRRDQVDVLVLETNPRATRVRLMVKSDRPQAAAATGTDAEVAERIVAALLDKMHLTVSVSAREAVAQDAEDAQRGPAIEVDVTGDDLSNLIGRRGETLDNLQYVARLLIAKELGRYVNLIIDVEGYKSHRAEMLKQVAQRLAEQVVNTHKPASMEPMPANERRIIHLALRDHPSVRTESVGLGERRKVTIVPKSAKR